MVSPFNGYITTDGKPFEHEIDATRHEARLALAKSFPELKGPQHDGGSFDLLADILHAYVMRRGYKASQKLPHAQWPDVVADAMSAENLGEVYKS